MATTDRLQKSLDDLRALHTFYSGKLTSYLQLLRNYNETEQNVFGERARAAKQIFDQSLTLLNDFQIRIDDLQSQARQEAATLLGKFGVPQKKTRNEAEELANELKQRFEAQLAWLQQSEQYLQNLPQEIFGFYQTTLQNVTKIAGMYAQLQKSGFSGAALTAQSVEAAALLHQLNEKTDRLQTALANATYEPDRFFLVEVFRLCQQYQPKIQQLTQKATEWLEMSRIVTKNLAECRTISLEAQKVLQTSYNVPPEVTTVFQGVATLSQEIIALYAEINQPGKLLIDNLTDFFLRARKFEDRLNNYTKTLLTFHTEAEKKLQTEEQNLDEEITKLRKWATFDGEASMREALYTQLKKTSFWSPPATADALIGELIRKHDRLNKIEAVLKKLREAISNQLAPLFIRTEGYLKNLQGATNAINNFSAQQISYTNSILRNTILQDWQQLFGRYSELQQRPSTTTEEVRRELELLQNETPWLEKNAGLTLTILEAEQREQNLKKEFNERLEKMQQEYDRKLEDWQTESENTIANLRSQIQAGERDQKECRTQLVALQNAVNELKHSIGRA